MDVMLVVTILSYERYLLLFVVLHIFSYWFVWLLAWSCSDNWSVTDSEDVALDTLFLFDFKSVDLGSPDTCTSTKVFFRLFSDLELKLLPTSLLFDILHFLPIAETSASSVFFIFCESTCHGRLKFQSQHTFLCIFLRRWIFKFNLIDGAQI